MPGSDRNARTPLVEWFIPTSGIVLACGLAWGIGFLQARETEHRQQATSAYHDSAKTDAERACIGTKASAVFECVYEKVEASKEQAKAEQDLSAQQRAASAGLASSVVAFLTLLLSGIGLWFLRETLVATRDAVAETRDATGIMQRDFETRFRPWLLPSISGPFLPPNRNSVAFIPPQGETRFVHLYVTLTNKGDIPAVVEQFGMAVSNVNVHDHWQNIPCDLAQGESFSPTERSQDNLPEGLPMELLHDPIGTIRLMPGLGAYMTSNITIKCAVIYRDPLGIRREMGFSYRLNWPGGYFTRLNDPASNYDRKLEN